MQPKLVVASGLCCLLGACTFDAETSLALEGDAASADARPQADASTLPDCAFELSEICLQGAPDGPLQFPALFDTGTDPLCRSFTPAGGTEACLVLVESMQLGDGVTTVVTGSRPLIVASIGDILIEGTFDVSSHVGGTTGPGTKVDSCGPLGSADNDNGGSGGGAGGSFAGVGGNGGVGDLDDSLGGDGTGSGGTAALASAMPGAPMAGCPGSRGGSRSDAVGQGQGGLGGMPGGAVYFAAAGSFELGGDGLIRATGAGGVGGEQQSGGGGGGSGGYVRIDGTTVILAGKISANGGGGGEGGVRFVDGSTATGSDGDDGRLATMAARGGSGVQVGGDGGDGSDLTNLAGGVGESTNAGAGGGGGGAGFILVHGVAELNGTCSPAMTPLD